MKKYLISFFAVIMMVLLISSSGVYASSPGDSGMQVRLDRTPALQINVSRGDSLSFDFTAIVLLVNEDFQLPVMFGENHFMKVPYYIEFGNETWNISKLPGGNISYSLPATFQPFHTMDINGTVFNNTTFGSSFGRYGNFNFMPLPSINAEIFVNVSHYTLPLNLTAINRTANFDHNYALNNSTIEVSFNIVFDNSITNGGRLIMIERVRGTYNNSGLMPATFQGMIKNNDAGNYSGVALVDSGGLSHSKFLYWWPEAYRINGNTSAQLNFSPPRDIKDGALLVYSYALPNSTISISQDPYITVPGISLGPGSFVYYQNQIVNFIVLHSELISIGLVIGIAFIAFPYSVYRRRKL
ncbi:MAG: hypothetical protein ACP5NK_04700 [Thermoplasmata archaeon]